MFEAHPAVSDQSAPSTGLGVAPELTRDLPRWWTEVLVLTVGYLMYQGIQILVTGSRHSAVGRAQWVFDVEKNLHLDPERWLNGVVASSHNLVIITGFYYGILHFLVTPLMLVWLRMRRRNDYVRLRNVLIAVSLAALVTYWLLPVAPPRLSIPGIVDTLKVNNILSAAKPAGPAALANQYAAMPSLHVAWATWTALALVVAFRSSRWRNLAWVYPAATMLVVVGTGNHFLTDAVAGAALVGMGWMATRLLHWGYGGGIPTP